MALRMTGMVSGLDTDSLVQELVNVQKMRNKKVEDKKVTLEWKQDIWKTLNSKLYKFYTDSVSKIRLQSSYQTKKASTSNDKLVEVKAAGDTPIGSHKIRVDQLASSQYVTSGKIEEDKDGNKIEITPQTKLSELADLSKIKSGKLKIGNETLEINEENMEELTISDVVILAKEAGLNASFDPIQQRFFISSKESGLDNSFEISEEIVMADSEDGESISILEVLKLDSITRSETGEITTDANYSSVVKAQDSIVLYNGAQLRGSSNTISANGLTFTLIGADLEETVSVNVANDSQETYDLIKDFIKGYNEILEELNTRYYADSAGGYEPLTSEEKEAMTEEDIKKWESKIKDSLLRRDMTVNSLITSLKGVMGGEVELNGKKYSLSTFGIQTSDYTERGLLHIYGDKDDPTYSAKEDKLLKAIEEDPELIMEFFSQIGRNLYDTMNDKMKSIPNVRSALTFYNDKLMGEELREYEKKIATLEVKLYKMEEKYYQQFARMEVALSQLQSQSNYLYSMLGM